MWWHLPQMLIVTEKLTLQMLQFKPKEKISFISCVMTILMSSPNMPLTLVNKYSKNYPYTKRQYLTFGLKTIHITTLPSFMVRKRGNQPVKKQVYLPLYIQFSSSIIIVTKKIDTSTNKVIYKMVVYWIKCCVM